MRRLAAVVLAACAILPAVEEDAVLAANRAVSIEYQARFTSLASGLDSKLESERIDAMRALGLLRDPDSVPLLMPFLESGIHSEAEVVAACNVLGRLGYQTPLPTLKALCSDPNPEVRKAAVLALEQIGSIAADGWSERGNDKDAALRLAAAVNLGQLKHADAVKTLIEGLGHPKSLIRQASCIGLGRIGDASVGEQLRPMLTDADPDVRRYAAEAIAKLGYMPAAPDLLMALEANVSAPYILRSLRVLTGQDFGYDPHGPLTKRHEAIERGFAWLEQQAPKK